MAARRIFARTIAEIRERVPGCRVEVLIPDFRGDWTALETVMAARPDVLNHNMETVPRLYRQVRKGAVYERSLELLRRAREMAPGDAHENRNDAGPRRNARRSAGGDGGNRRAGHAHSDAGAIYAAHAASICPSSATFIPMNLRSTSGWARQMGFKHVEAGPLVRSSYHAFEQEEAAHC